MKNEGKSVLTTKFKLNKVNKEKHFHKIDNKIE